jgi:hypothetical protein
MQWRLTLQLHGSILKENNTGVDVLNQFGPEVSAVFS